MYHLCHVHRPSLFLLYHSAKSLSGNSSEGGEGGELRWTLGGTRGKYRNTARVKEATTEIPCRKSTNYRYYIYDRSFSLGCVHLSTMKDVCVVVQFYPRFNFLFSFRYGL